ncbi:unnamed protein product [Trifolium pratense]|uniref:Uncharacterized protein n=1 Tax=Trifolium pratense TaxID=57577 RepID=A0ACB0K4K3_TRIPR|nr:unnamed protein product [Trifolium pratense]
MGYYMKMLVFTTLIILFGSQQIRAVRPLSIEKEFLLLQKNVAIQSLQRGPVQGSQTNPCSTVPGRNHGRCTLANMNVAGHVAHPIPPPFPVLV